MKRSACRRIQSTAFIAVAWTALAAIAADKVPPNKHVWGQAALARCSSPYQREPIADPQARDGKAVRFTGEAGFNGSASP